MNENTTTADLNRSNFKLIFLEDLPEARSLAEELKQCQIKYCGDCHIIIAKGFCCGACNDVSESEVKQ